MKVRYSFIYDLQMIAFESRKLRNDERKEKKIVFSKRNIDMLDFWVLFKQEREPSCISLKCP